MLEYDIVAPMKAFFVAVALAAAASALLPAADTNEQIVQQLVALERSAMDGWKNGNPDPLLAISDPEVTYYHAVTNGRIDGLAALKQFYEGYRGRALFDTYEIQDPKVQVHGDVAILTYHFVRSMGGVSDHWNATQVYLREAQGWKVIHTHWSMTNPPMQPSAAANVTPILPTL